MAGAVFLFDFDQTLYAYDFRRRLPRLSELSGVSQYRLAKQWWAAGFEAAAESGAYPTTEAYLDAFAAETGARLTADDWVDARLAAMTPIPSAIAALRRAAELGTVSLLSNNPSIFREQLPRLAPEVAEVLAGHDLVSASLGVRKPDARIYLRALDRFGAAPADVFFADDHDENVHAARDVGLTGFQVRAGADDDGLLAAVEAFASGRAEARAQPTGSDGSSGPVGD